METNGEIHDFGFKENRLLLQMIRKNFSEKDIYDFKEIDWTKLIALLNQHRLFLNALNILKTNCDSMHYGELESNRETQLFRLTRNLQQIKRFATEAHREKLRFVVVKGFALSHLIYNDCFSRQFNDVDILVDENDLVKADYILRQLGYVQCSHMDFKKRKHDDIAYPLSRRPGSHHLYEYLYECENGEWIFCELHRSLHMISNGWIKDFLWHTQEIYIDGMEFTTLNKNYAIAYMFINAYMDTDSVFGMQNRPRIRGYIELYNTLKKQVSDTEWNEISSLLAEQGFGEIVNRVLEHLYELYLDTDCLEKRLISNEMIVDKHQITGFINRMFINKDNSTVVDLIRRLVFHDRRPIEVISDTFAINSMKKYSCMFPVDIMYSMTYNREGLHFYVLVDKQIWIHLEYYMFQFMVYNNEKDNSILLSMIEISVENNKGVCKLINSPIYKNCAALRNMFSPYILDCSINRIKDKILLDCQIQYEAMNLYERFPLLNLAYSFSWYKYMHHSVFYIMENREDSLDKAVLVKTTK